MTPTKESNWFTHTSDKPYDRHTYNLCTKNNKSLVFDDYEQLRAAWFQTCHLGQLSHVEILDAQPVRTSDSKGFA